MKNIKISKEEIENLEIRSEEVQEIIGKTPSKIIRYGISVIFSIIMLLVVISIFFKYPDIIHARFTITSSNPPVYIKAKKNGIIDMLFYNDLDTVMGNSVIAVIEDAADYKDILYLSDYIRKIQLTNDIIEVPESGFKLGELQTHYANLIRTISDYNEFIQNDFISLEIGRYKEREKYYSDYLKNLQSQFKLKQEENLLIKNKFSRDSLLFKQGVIPIAEFEKSKQVYLQSSQEIEQMLLELTKGKLEINSVNQTIESLKQKKHEKSTMYMLNIKESIEQLEGLIDVWKEKNLLVSPVKGQVSFSRVWEDKQFVSVNQTVFTIAPLDQNEIIGRIIIPIKRSGKIEPGQEINLKFDNYPYHEFGMVKTRLQRLSLVPDSVYIGSMILSDTLVTNYGKTIPFSQNLQGNAEIITKDLSIIIRVVSPIRNILKEYF